MDEDVDRRVGALGRVYVERLDGAGAIGIALWRTQARAHEIAIPREALDELQQIGRIDARRRRAPPGPCPATLEVLWRAVRATPAPAAGPAQAWRSQPWRRSRPHRETGVGSCEIASPSPFGAAVYREDSNVRARDRHGQRCAPHAAGVSPYTGSGGCQWRSRSTSNDGSSPSRSITEWARLAFSARTNVSS